MCPLQYIQSKQRNEHRCKLEIRRLQNSIKPRVLLEECTVFSTVMCWTERWRATEHIRLNRFMNILTTSWAQFHGAYIIFIDD